MKLALVTTHPAVRSGIGDYTRHLLPYLREHCAVDVFVGPTEHPPAEGCRPVADLVPRDYDQILYQLGNELSHAFMARMIRAIGGTVMQHDWVLFDMALVAWPALARGGAKGHALALREGGVEQMRRYARNWLDRRRQRSRPASPMDVTPLPGTLLAGWFHPEEGGRWTSDSASLRIPAEGVREVRIEVHADAGRTVRLRHGDAAASGAGGVLTIEPAEADRPLVFIDTDGIRVTDEQRRHGDSRRLGCFVQRVSWCDAAGPHDLDLAQAAALPNVPINLSRDRFGLPLNRSVVRFADAFIVHSEYVRQLILRDRNSVTPTGILHHGSEFRWRDDDRALERSALGLDEEWTRSFLVTSFGGVQAHKRIDKALEALALARRERADIRMVLAGSISSADFDPRALAERLGVADAVRFTGFVSEETGWNWLHAGDIALNLRGPSSGGTSGGIFQAFSMGRSVIASDAAEQTELPDACVVKIPLGAEEVPALARTLVELRDDPARRVALEGAVRDFVREECHWGIVAKRYAEYLAAFPPPRATRRGLIAMKLSLARER